MPTIGPLPTSLASLSNNICAFCDPITLVSFQFWCLCLCSSFSIEAPTGPPPLHLVNSYSFSALSSKSASQGTFSDSPTCIMSILQTHYSLHLSFSSGLWLFVYRCNHSMRSRNDFLLSSPLYAPYWTLHLIQLNIDL